MTSLCEVCELCVLCVCVPSSVHVHAKVRGHEESSVTVYLSDAGSLTEPRAHYFGKIGYAVRP